MRTVTVKINVVHNGFPHERNIQVDNVPDDVNANVIGSVIGSKLALRWSDFNWMVIGDVLCE